MTNSGLVDYVITNKIELVWDLEFGFSLRHKILLQSILCYVIMKRTAEAEINLHNSVVVN